MHMKKRRLLKYSGKSESHVTLSYDVITAACIGDSSAVSLVLEHFNAYIHQDADTNQADKGTEGAGETQEAGTATAYCAALRRDRA